jgi:NADH-quinone oxidoreductase subunit L
MLENAYLIPLLPALSFVVILFFGKRLNGGASAHWIGIATVGVVWVLSLVLGAQWIDRVDNAASESKTGTETHSEEDTETHSEEEGLAPVVVGATGTPGDTVLGVSEEGGHSAGAEPVITQIAWLQSGGTEHKVGTYVDGLSAILLVIVSSVSLLVHIYSTEYVKGDRRYVHYYAFLSLFTASMLFFVLSSSILQMIVGWELVGVCSFALIGHWWEEGANTNAALKAFLTNRVGDIGLLVGMIILFVEFGSFDIDYIVNHVPDVSHLVLLMASISLIAAVMSKSGQFPLHTWLPDAMAGPTPVSALIHAATMVVAGVYMVARLYPVFYEGFSIETSSINLLAFIGGFTALMAAALAFVQWDIKKVLAYSTVSQLGYMVMALGVGAWVAAIFHLFTHALFKACLFLGAGSVSHAAGHTFDMRQMGGLRKKMPVTFWTFVLSSLALAGIFPFAGFWSKDEILLGAFVGQENSYPLMLVFGCAVAAMTAAYMTRVIWYTFFGEFRGDTHGHGDPHESPRVMTIPLILLAIGAVVAGVFNLPSGVVKIFGAEGFAHQVQTYVEPGYVSSIVSHPKPSLNLALVGLGLAIAGIVVTYLYFWKQAGPQGLSERNSVAKTGRTFLENKYYLDYLYNDIIVKSIKFPIAKAAVWINQNVLDKTVNTVGESARDGGALLYRYFDQAVVDGAVNNTGAAAQASGEGLRVVQSGKVQNYGALLFGAAAVLAIIFVIVI